MWANHWLKDHVLLAAYSPMTKKSQRTDASRNRRLRARNAHPILEVWAESAYSPDLHRFTLNAYRYLREAGAIVDIHQTPQELRSTSEDAASR